MEEPKGGVPPLDQENDVYMKVVGNNITYYKVWVLLGCTCVLLYACFLVCCCMCAAVCLLMCMLPVCCG